MRSVELMKFAKAFANSEIFVTDALLEEIKLLFMLIPHKILSVQVSKSGDCILAICQYKPNNEQLVFLWDGPEETDAGWLILPEELSCQK